MNNKYIELQVLKNIDQAISQKLISEKIGCSVGKVNSIIKELLNKDLIKIDDIATNNKKQYKYTLTDEGIKYKIFTTDLLIKDRKKECEILEEDLKRYKIVYKSEIY